MRRGGDKTLEGWHSGVVSPDSTSRHPCDRSRTEQSFVVIDDTLRHDKLNQISGVYVDLGQEEERIERISKSVR